MTELDRFVREALSLGRSREEVRGVLGEAGWPADEVDDALSNFAEIAFPVPVPRRRTSGSAREAFLYLVTFLTLYTASISLGYLLSGFVDTALPDLVQDPYQYEVQYRNENIRWLMASLMVSFPAWLLLTRSHLITYSKDPARRASGVRRWLTYLTLFVAASVVLTTLIVLLAGALGGEHVLRTLLKSLIVIFISGGIFGFYLWDMQRGEGQGRR